MKKQYIIPAVDIVVLHTQKDLLVEETPVNPVSHETTEYDSNQGSFEADEDELILPQQSLWDK